MVLGILNVLRDMIECQKCVKTKPPALTVFIDGPCPVNISGPFLAALIRDQSKRPQASLMIARWTCLTNRPEDNNYLDTAD